MQVALNAGMDRFITKPVSSSELDLCLKLANEKRESK